MLTHGIRRGLVVVALGAMSLLGAACASTQQGYQAPPMDPAVQARAAAISPMANLDSHNMTYVGQLPPTVAPTSDNRVDALGDPQFLDTTSAVARFGEQRIRTQVVRNVRLCARVELQKIALSELRRQTDAAETHQAGVAPERNVTSGIAYGGLVGGAFQAWNAFGKDYGLTYVLGNLLPGAANQYTYGRVLEQNDIMIAVSLANNRFWYSQNDFWLEAMGEWCPAFISWVSVNGQIVEAGAPPPP